MPESMKVEQLTPFDLLMPRTYVGALFAFRSDEDISSIQEDLQRGLDGLLKQLPWLSGGVFPVTANTKPLRDGRVPGLEIRWNSRDHAPTIINKGTIEASYDSLAAKGMLPSAVRDYVWPVPFMIDDALFSAGAPIFGASLFKFSNDNGVGLCICVHHNAVDATGFTEIVKLWTQNIRGIEVSLQDLDLDRSGRLFNALSPELRTVSAQSTTSVLGSHPEYSTTPPTLPTRFPPCTSELFKIPVARINTLKERLSGFMPICPATNTVICALIWSSITRARLQRKPSIGAGFSRLAMAVNGRQRMDMDFSSTEHPYIGNLVLYSMATLSTQDCSTSVDLQTLVKVCNTITESQTSERINIHHIAEVYHIVHSIEDYRTIFPGWDLFHSRDLTITSWAGLDLYGLDFGTALGTPGLIRMPYAEADGVGIILPRKRACEEVLEITVMLRKDDMAAVNVQDVLEGFLL